MAEMFALHMAVAIQKSICIVAPPWKNMAASGSKDFVWAGHCEGLKNASIPVLCASRCPWNVAPLWKYATLTVTKVPPVLARMERQRT